MVYHFNPNFVTRLNSIQKCAVRRLKYFAEKGIPSKILTVDFCPNGNNFHLHDLDPKDIANMYDYFQQATNIPRAKTTVDSIFPAHLYDVQAIDNTKNFKVYRNKRYIAHVRSPDGTAPNVVSYWDGKNWVKSETYDHRGFLSYEKVFAPKDVLLAEFYYTPSGEKVLEKFYAQKDGEDKKSELTTIGVKSPVNGLWHRMTTDNELVTHFFATFFVEGDIVIDDALIQWDFKPLLDSKAPIKIVPVFHSAHLVYGSDKVHGCFAAVLDNIDKIAAVIVQTRAQKDDITATFGHEDKMWVIPVGSRVDVPQNPARNSSMKIIYVGRHRDVKRIKDTIQAFAYIVRRLPKARLHVCGINKKGQEVYGKLAKELGITHAVKISDFVPNLHQEYSETKIMLLTSKNEGCPLVLIEAASYGIPVVSYDIKYGPAELVINGESGFLTAEDPKEMSQKAVRLLTEPELYVKFSDRAYAHSFNFTMEEHMSRWLELLERLT